MTCLVLVHCKNPSERYIQTIQECDLDHCTFPKSNNLFKPLKCLDPPAVLLLMVDYLLTADLRMTRELVDD